MFDYQRVYLKMRYFREDLDDETVDLGVVGFFSTFAQTTMFGSGDQSLLGLPSRMISEHSLDLKPDAHPRIAQACARSIRGRPIPKI